MLTNEQKAALTEEERDIAAQAEKPYGSVDERYLRDWLCDMLARLADARIERDDWKATAEAALAEPQLQLLTQQLDEARALVRTLAKALGPFRTMPELNDRQGARQALAEAEARPWFEEADDV